MSIDTEEPAVTDEPVLTPPKPGEPGYDWAADYGTDDLYVHTFSFGTVVALRPFGAIYKKTWLRKLRNARSDFELESAALDRAACPAAQEVLDNLPDDIDRDDDPIDELFKAWAAAGTSSGGDEGLTAGN